VRSCTVDYEVSKRKEGTRCARETRGAVVDFDKSPSAKLHFTSKRKEGTRCARETRGAVVDFDKSHAREVAFYYETSKRKVTYARATLKGTRGAVADFDKSARAKLHY
jgi:hypothetical protein